MHCRSDLCAVQNVACVIPCHKFEEMQKEMPQAHHKLAPCMHSCFQECMHYPGLAQAQVVHAQGDMT